LKGGLVKKRFFEKYLASGVGFVDLRKASEVSYFTLVVANASELSSKSQTDRFTTMGFESPNRPQ
tara:strand:- start:1161 stop:1355 length:195 start_codon:yes stop_codon:yes gene_type:complete